MIELTFASLFIPAFIAGVLIFFAPCTLPLVPAYLAFISGVSSEELQGADSRRRARRKILFNSIAYVCGFSVIFIIFGALTGLLGQSLVPYRMWLTRIAGVFVMLFGLFMLQIIRIPFLASEHRVVLPAFFRKGTPISSFLLGASFAFGWTPCVGPVLGSILLIASTSTTVAQGVFLLMVFSCGLAIPFLLIAAIIDSASRVLVKYSKFFTALNIVGGIFLVLIGVLLLTNNFSLLVSYGFYIFGFLEYQGILDYL